MKGTARSATDNTGNRPAALVSNGGFREATADGTLVTGPKGDIADVCYSIRLRRLLSGTADLLHRPRMIAFTMQ